MPNPLASVDLSNLSVGATGTYNFQSNGVKTFVSGSHLKFTNISAATLQITILPTNDNFTLNAGGILIVPLDATIYAFSWSILLLQSGGGANASLQLLFYDVGDTVDEQTLAQPNMSAQQRNVAVPIGPGISGGGIVSSTTVGNLAKMTPGFYFSVNGQYAGKVITVYLNNLSIMSGVISTGTAWSEWAFLLALQDNLGNDLVTPVEIWRMFFGVIPSPAYNYPPTNFSPWAQFTCPSGNVVAAVEGKLQAVATGTTSAFVYGHSISVDPLNGTSVPSVGSVYRGFAAGATF